MKKLLVRAFVGAFLFASHLVAASESNENAKVTLTVVNFRSLMSPADIGYVDAVMSLAPHASVTQIDRNGMPTLRCTRPVSIEIKVVGANPADTYRALAVYFKQHTDAGTAKLDLGGKKNFESSRLADGTLVFRNKCLQAGRDGRYEFFVLVEQTSTGNIGLIDPGIENDE